MPDLNKSQRIQVTSICLLVVLLCLSLGLRHTLQAQAPQRGTPPPLHLGSFERPYGINTCLSMAEQALTQDGLRIGSKQGWERIAQNGNVVVAVACAPLANGKTRIVVIATSTDSGTAEFYRNDIRARIQRQVVID